MRSIPLVMTWQILHCGHLAIVACMLVANILPLLLFGLMRTQGLEADDPSMSLFIMKLMSLNVLVCGASVLSVEEFRMNLFVLPVSTAKLVACLMIPLMLLAGLEMYCLTALQNAIFGQNFPLWGPAVFAVAGTGAFWANLWFTRDAASQPFAMFAVLGTLGGWYFLRYYPRLSDTPTDVVLDVTKFEMVALIFVAVASYFVAVAGFARNRCGEQLKPIRFLQTWRGFLEFEPNSTPVFRTPLEAQFWLEWRKGGAIPSVVAFAILFVFGIWLIQNRDLRELINGFVIGGFFLSFCAGMAGLLVIGRCDFVWNDKPKHPEFEIGHFLASRPITNTAIANTILKVVVKSVLIGWVIWAASFLFVSGILFVTGLAPEPFMPSNVRWWYFPSTLLAWWTATSVCASIMLTGQNNRGAQFIVCGFGLLFIGIVASEWLLSAEAKLQLFHTAAAIGGIALVVGSAWVFAVARRKHLVVSTTIACCGAVWVVLSAIIVVEWVRHPIEPLAISIFVVGLAALAVVPFAAAPLAISLNRNR